MMFPICDTEVSRGLSNTGGYLILLDLWEAMKRWSGLLDSIKHGGTRAIVLAFVLRIDGCDPE